MIQKSTDLIRDLDIYKENMLNNLELTNGLIFSQSVLLALTLKGVSRETAYAIVQRNALKVWDDKIGFQSALSEDKQVKKYLSPDELEQIFDIDNRLKNIDYIFNKVGLE
jgi:adenylosuccinate lyase